MLHICVLLLCNLSYIQLGKLDSTIPQPKPHLTVTCFMKLLAYIPFTIGLQFSHFQNVTKLIRDVLIMCYIIAQYYTMESHPIYKLLTFDFFAIFALPLILEGWQANNPNCILYLIKFYSLYIPLFINQLLVHDNKVAQTVFLLALLEIPSMVYRRIDKDFPEIKMDSYIFKLVKLPQQKLAILHCTSKNSNQANQVGLAIACIKKINDNDEWTILKSITVSHHTSDLNYIAQSHVIVISSCSELKVYDASTLKLLKTNIASRAYKRLSFIAQDHLFASLKKSNSYESQIQISDSIFATLIASKMIPLDTQPEISMFIKYPIVYNTNGVNQKLDKYLFICVPSDRLNSLMVADFNHQNEPSGHKDLHTQHNSQESSVSSAYTSNVQTSQIFNNKSQLNKIIMKSPFQNKEELSEDDDDVFELIIPSIAYAAKRTRSNSFSGEYSSEINLHEHLKQSAESYSSVLQDDQKSTEIIKEYQIDGSAIIDILVHEHLLIISCSEKVVFFDLRLRRIIKRIFTLSFDTRVYWIKITEKYTYFLLSNEIKAWMARQDNHTQCMEIIEHYNFFGIRYIIENPCCKGLYVIYNNAICKQKIALINLPTE